MNQTASQKETPTTGSNQVAGETQNDSSIVCDDQDEDKSYAALVKQAQWSGHTLQKVATGFILRRGNSSLHFSDVHTAKALIDRLKCHRRDGHSLATK